MSSCRDITSLLIAEPDGALNAAALAQIEAHVATCSSCQRQRAILAAVPRALRAATAAIASPNPDREWDLLRERIQETNAERRTSEARESQASDRSAGDSRWASWLPGRQAPPLRRALTWGLPLAAAAALVAPTLLRQTPSSSSSHVHPAIVASASSPSSATSSASSAGSSTSSAKSSPFSVASPSSAATSTFASATPATARSDSAPAETSAPGAGLVYVDQESGWLIVWSETPTG